MADRRPKVDFDSAEKLLLFRLHLALAKSEKINTEIRVLSRKLKLPEQLGKICADRLQSRGLCEINEVSSLVEHPETGQLVDVEELHLAITANGVEEVEWWSEDDYRAVAIRSGLPSSEWELERSTDFEQAGKHGIIESAGGDLLNIATELTGAEEFTSADLVPAADRIVSLDHNSREYGEAVEAVDKVISEVVGDNEYGSEKPEEKEALLSSLKGGRRLLEASEASVSAVKATLLSALQYIANNFAKGAIAAMAGTAITAVAKLFGII